MMSDAVAGSNNDRVSLRGHPRPRPMDWIAAGYLLWLTVAILLSPRRPEEWRQLVALNLVGGTLILAAAWNRHRLMRPLRLTYDWYPVWGIAFVFEEMRNLMHLVVTKWYDEFFLSIDVRFFGGFPSCFFEQFYNRPLNEILLLGYFSYYVIPYILCIPLYLRRDRAAFHQSAAAIFISFLVCLVLFLIFPTQGPRLFYGHFRTASLDGYFITWLEHRMVEMGGLVGGAFPSSHCAVAMAALLQAWQHHRGVFHVFLVLVPLLSFATVYGWYHYTVDVSAGWAVGMGAVWLAGRLYPVRR
ncbi:phosphatase PAP2 family protein [Candidatus Fermentibacteria bacterium]|nr:phosphatase PAP2 family protein [Candidatus Fermentibacteria bacterium]